MWFITERRVFLTLAPTHMIHVLPDDYKTIENLDTFKFIMKKKG